jgi:hypothetical protein
VKVGGPVEDAIESGEGLGAFSFGNKEYGKPFTEVLADCLEDAWLGDKKKGADKAGPLQLLFKVLGQAVSNHDLVAGVRQLDRNDVQRCLLRP